VVQVSVNELRPWQAVVNTYSVIARVPVVYFVCRSFSKQRRHRPSLLQMQGCQWKLVGSWQNVAFVVIVSEWSHMFLYWSWIYIYYRIYVMIDVLLLRCSAIHLRNISHFCLKSASRIYVNACVCICNDVCHGIMYWYTTPNNHCWHRQYKCDGGIMLLIQLVWFIWGRCILDSENWLLQGQVYMYYSLTNFYQNHRRYVKSRDDYQLLGASRGYSSLSTDCEPYRGIANGSLPSGGVPYAPCGAIANSLFNGELNVYIMSIIHSILQLPFHSSVWLHYSHCM